MLEIEKEDLEEAERKIRETEKKIKEKITFLSKYNHKTQQFLLKHLGIYEDKLVLTRRLDSNWQKFLKKKGVLNISIPHR